MDRFNGKLAIVTGAGSGLGKAVALRFAGEGANVACLDVALAAAEETVAELQRAGGQGAAFHCDVADPSSVRAAVERSAAGGARPEILVNSAGVGCFANSHEMPYDDWARIIAINLTGTFLMCQAALSYMLDGGGNIVNVASNAGLMGQPYSAAYCASKGGVVQLTRALADEYISRGVRVNAVAPGGIATPMQTSFHSLPADADPKRLAKLRTPLGMSTAEEIAALIAFVASEEGRYMTGSIVSIDGGLTV